MHSKPHLGLVALQWVGGGHVRPTQCAKVVGNRSLATTLLPCATHDSLASFEQSNTLMWNNWHISLFSYLFHTFFLSLSLSLSLTLSLSLSLSHALYTNIVVPLLSSTHKCPVSSHYPFSCSACLSFSDQNATQSAAAQDCSKQGGELVTLRDDTEWRILQLYLESLNLSDFAMWVGYRYVYNYHLIETQYYMRHQTESPTLL